MVSLIFSWALLHYIRLIQLACCLFILHV